MAGREGRSDEASERPSLPSRKRDPMSQDALIQSALAEGASPALIALLRNLVSCACSEGSGTGPDGDDLLVATSTISLPAVLAIPASTPTAVASATYVSDGQNRFRARFIGEFHTASTGAVAQVTGAGTGMSVLRALPMSIGGSPDEAVLEVMVGPLPAGPHTINFTFSGSAIYSMVAGASTLTTETFSS